MDDQIKSLLFLAQLEEYDKDRINNWLKRYHLNKLSQTKKKLIYTKKIILLKLIIQLLTLAGVDIVRALFITLNLISFPDIVIKKIVINLALLKLRLYREVKIIGITGSYGKTSTKEILYHLLSAKYKVLKTPENYNTPLGIAKTILSNDLKVDFLIAEMGAYHKGDIKQMCKLYKPKYGILTAIGPQHIERFGSVEEVAAAKSELFYSFDGKGLAVTDADNKYCLEIAKNTPDLVQMYTLKRKFNHTDKYKMMFVDNIKVSQNGTDFRINNYNKFYFMHTKLLGEPNVRNIMAALILAKYLLIDWKTIQKSIVELDFIPHRLQLIKGVNDTTILDDSYNANPDSVREALKVLNLLHAPVKIVITPGLVELGEIQNQENEIYGENIGKSADYLIVVGHTNEESLKKGFLKNKPIDKLILAENLKDATDKLSTIIIPGSVILFSNDLPDQYQ